MNARTAACPPKKLLTDFGLGVLDERAAETLSEHLETCADCRAEVDGVANDSFLTRMRQAVGAKPARMPPGPAVTNIPGDESVSNAASSSETPATADAVRPSTLMKDAAKKDAEPVESLPLPPALAESPDYEVIKVLGQGGMGIVYLARNRAMDRLEVLKVVSKALLDRPGALERFRQEIRAAARLLHPNIVAAHSVPRLGDLLVFAMEYVDGQDLAQVVKRRGPLPVTNATFYSHQVALGLQHAHEKGMVHRDIKPGNLMLAIEGKKHVIKILDFGLAKATSEKAIDGALTKSGQMLGTPDYIAPEQALDAQKADIRADVYSLGCTLYFLLTGHAPFRGVNLMEILIAHHQTLAQPLNLARADVPAELAEIVAKMMAKDPANRFQTPGEVAKALAPFFKAPPVSPEPQATAHALPLPSADAMKAAPGRPQKQTMPGSRRLLPPIAIGLLLLGFIGAAAMIFKVKTADGVVVVTVNVPNPEVLVDGNRIMVTWAEGGKQAEIHLPPGSRKIELKKDGFKAFGETVSIEDGGQELLAATLEPIPPSPLAGEGPGVRGSGTAPPLAIAPFDAQQARMHQEAWAKHLGVPVEQTNLIGMKLVLIPPGEFLMGSTPEQRALGSKIADDSDLPDESPQHRVAITKPYWLGMTEVTTAEFKKFVEAAKHVTQAEQFGFGNHYLTTADATIKPEMKKMTWRTPGYAITDDSPVTQVTWNDAIQFCDWLSEQEKLKPCYRQDAKDGWILLPSGTGYRLPTEAEWEYACRAGTITQFSFGDDPAMLDNYGWYYENSGGSARAVGLKAANPFGLFDMHGNAYEWCHDFFGGSDYYLKSPPADPFGSASGSGRVTRGGHWAYGPVSCRAAFRYSDLSAYRGASSGFRIVRVSVKAVPPVAAATSTTSQPNVLATSGTGQPNQPWNTPAFQAWMKDVAALPAVKQVEAVRNRLKELNPGFDGKMTGWYAEDTPRIENGVVTALGLLVDNVTDISPVRALLGLKRLNFYASNFGKGILSDLSPVQGMHLTKLSCSSTLVSDLSPLKNMPLTDLSLWDCRQVSDLTPLEGMPLTALGFAYSEVRDLTLLRGMPLTSLHCAATKVSDLSPLKGMKLVFLACYGTPVSDLTPLDGMNLVDLRFTSKNITKGMNLVRQMKSLEFIGVGNASRLPTAVYWTKYDAGEFGEPAPSPSPQPSPLKGEPSKAFNDPAFQAWMKDVATLPAKKQVEAVAQKLVELNPGFDGKVARARNWPDPKIENGVVTEFGFATDNVTDISPVRALVGLKVLGCGGGAGGTQGLSDLSPLQGMSLQSLFCGYTQVSDLSALQGMKLTTLNFPVSKVTDLSPLHGMPLTGLTFQQNPVSDLSPLKGMKLTGLNCCGTQVSDLSPLKGMPLRSLNCRAPMVSDLAPLQDCKSLTMLDILHTKVTAAGVADLQKALPNCKIEWDDPAKAVAGQPNQPWNTPAFQQWRTATQALPAEKQIEAVSKRLMDLNPGFDGKVAGWLMKGTPKIEGGVVTEFGFFTDRVADISPVRALVSIKNLSCPESAQGKGILSDLSPLQGMKLTMLQCRLAKGSDLSPLRGMPLTSLYLNGPVSDLSSLQGMPLTTLNVVGTQVSDLSPLKGMPLTHLYCPCTPVSDLSPLVSMPTLINLDLRATKVTPAGLSDLQKALPNCNIEWPTTGQRYRPTGTPAKPITTINAPGFQAWMKQVAAMPAEKQVQAVSKKLMELNPGFDGMVAEGPYYGIGTPKIENGVVTVLSFFTDNVTDISPVRALVGLQALGCCGSAGGKGRLSDLSPLDGMSLRSLTFADTQVSDLSALKGMALTQLHFPGTQVTDLSPLQGMPLTALHCHAPYVSDLSPLQECKSLTSLFIEGTKVTPAAVAALQKALPNCKIEWDDPAKPATPKP